jgi:hypothetical protein
MTQLMKYASQGKFESAEHINNSLLFWFGDNMNEDYIKTLIEIELKARTRFQLAVQRALKVRLLSTIGYCQDVLKNIPINATMSATLQVRLLQSIGCCEELLARHSDFNATAPARRMPNSGVNATALATHMPNSGFNATAPARRMPTDLQPKDVKPVVSFETKEVSQKYSSKTASCNVCYEDYNIRNFVQFGCSHEFCSTCSNKLTAMEPKKCVCPLCRKKIERVHITMYEYV